MIYSGGNRSQLDNSETECLRIADYFDCHVIAYEYPKYRMPASPTDIEVFATIREVYNFVAKEHEHVILWGRSVGGAPTCFLASQPDVKYEAVVIQSTFTSALKWGVPWFPFYMFIDILRNIDCIKHFRKDKPVFLFHWEGDEVIPYIHSVDLKNECVANHVQCKLRVYSLDEMYLHKEHMDVRPAEELTQNENTDVQPPKGLIHNEDMKLSIMFPLGLEGLYSTHKTPNEASPS